MATTAKPTASVVKALDLRSINNALNAVQQQLNVINQAIEAVARQAGQTAFASGQGQTNVSQLQQQIASMQQQLATLAAGGVGPTATYRADVAISSGDPVYTTSNGGVSPIDTQDPTSIFACVGIATSNAGVRSNVTVRRAGVMAIVGADFEVGRAVYAQAGAGVTQEPNYATVAIPVGVAVSQTEMDVRGAWPALLDLPAYPGGPEDYMPVALRLVRDTLDFIGTIFGQDDGIVVKIGNQLVTREIVTPSGSGLNVLNGDGVGGNPSIS